MKIISIFLFAMALAPLSFGNVGDDPIADIVAQLEKLNENIEVLNANIDTAEMMVQAEWNRTNKDIESGLKFVSPITLLKLGAFIGIPIALVQIIGTTAGVILLVRHMRFKDQFAPLNV